MKLRNWIGEILRWRPYLRPILEGEARGWVVRTWGSQTRLEQRKEWGISSVERAFSGRRVWNWLDWNIGKREGRNGKTERLEVEEGEEKPLEWELRIWCCLRQPLKFLLVWEKLSHNNKRYFWWEDLDDAFLKQWVLGEISSWKFQFVGNYKKKLCKFSISCRLYHNGNLSNTE